LFENTIRLQYACEEGEKVSGQAIAHLVVWKGRIITIVQRDYSFRKYIYEAKLLGLLGRLAASQQRPDAGLWGGGRRRCQLSPPRNGILLPLSLSHTHTHTHTHTLSLSLSLSLFLSLCHNFNGSHAETNKHPIPSSSKMVRANFMWEARFSPSPHPSLSRRQEKRMSD
jgi:hypothetical protein